MPRDISGHATILIYYDESAGLIETCWTDRSALGPRTEIIKWTLAASQQREIRQTLRPQDDGHFPQS